MSILNGHARWAFDLAAWRPTLTDLLLASACVQIEEKERLGKFVFRNDFEASLIGRLLMRKFVSDTTGRQYNDIVFDRDESGRPRIVDAQQHTTYRQSPFHLDFNVSHQGNYAVLAGYVFDHNKSSAAATTSFMTKPSVPQPSIGVDVMKIEYNGGKPLHEFFRIMHRNFSTREWSYIMSKNTELGQTEAFMRHWCLKESYVKNIGVGITIDLQTISFGIKTNALSAQQPISDTTLTVENKLAQNWIFQESLIDDSHCAAVALNNFATEPPLVPFEIIDFKQLMFGSIPLLENDPDYCALIVNKSYKTF